MTVNFQDKNIDKYILNILYCHVIVFIGAIKPQSKEQIHSWNDD